MLNGETLDAAALYDAGLSHLRLEEWRPALQRFLELARGYTGPDAEAVRAAAKNKEIELDG